MKWIWFSLLTISIHAQNTVGVLSHDAQRSLEGYNLFAPNNQSTTYLIDNCGRIVHVWEDNPSARSGAEQYLLPNGNILKAKADIEVVNSPTIGAGGAGGIIEIKSWDNQLLWQYIIQDSLQRQHHDIHYMPNGHVLAIVWDRYYMADIVQAGFDTLAFSQTELWPDKIVEIDPTSNEVVWQWKAWDHFVQDRFQDKDNFGIVSEHPELIDINYQDFTFGRSDFMHTNGIDYNPDLDQILLSVKNFNEIWIIDHSTTTLEAASHTGGNSGRGGDLMFRWGNPHAYKNASLEDQKLFDQHDPEWIVNDQSIYDGQILLYNNFIEIDLSLGVILNPIFDENSQNYVMDEGKFLPATITRNISHPDTILNYSTAGSNIDLLHNGNFLMHAARPGFAFELTDDEEVVWEYKIPIRNGVPIEQGSVLEASDNFTFSLRRYPVDFAGFEGKDLAPMDYLELNPDIAQCSGLVGLENFDEWNSLSIYPNPSSDVLNIEGIPKNGYIEVYDILGNKLFHSDSKTGTIELVTATFPAGTYFLRLLPFKRVYRFVKI